MASSGSDDRRATKLLTLFKKVLCGERPLSTAKDGKLFIEAICLQADPPTCAYNLISSPAGISALQASVRFDTSITFLNDSAVHLLCYLQTPSLKVISSGSVLAQLLLSMVEPPFFWDALTKSFTDGLMNPNASKAFAWLLLELISLPGKASSPYLAVVKSSNILDMLLKSLDGETRILGQKIKHILLLNASQLHNDTAARPGGRHDNDHEDYREVSIMPTADELFSKDRPFFRTTDFISDPELSSSRSSIHLDNQFRLLREDMLGEIREELKILTGSKTGSPKSIIIDELSLAGVEMGTDRKRLPWGIMLECKGELPHLRRIKPQKRMIFLRENRNILRQGSIACLLVDGHPIAFPIIHRDEDMLLEKRAAIILQFSDDSSLSYVLSKIKLAGNVKLVQLDTAIFAFEPFLRRLKEMKDLPLRDELLHWDIGKGIGTPSFKPTEIIKVLKSLSGKDLKNVLRLEKSVILDKSQMESLCACLIQRVSLVQGPPGGS